MSSHTNRNLEDQQRNAWKRQIQILKDQLSGYQGVVYFEFSIPRMGKKVDNILLINDCIYVIEFKVGSNRYERHAEDQVIDYALDLKNFHEGSHSVKVIPILVATDAGNLINNQELVFSCKEAAKCNSQQLATLVQSYLKDSQEEIDILSWEASQYKPTPTIIEAAQALYKGHNVKEISRSDSGAINLSKTTACLNNIIDKAKIENRKAICFVTGVPGAGKTLAGLNIANERMKSDEDEHAVFLSGNGPLVDVLREALARDLVLASKSEGERIKKDDARRKTSTFIQNIHHFRDEYLKNPKSPVEKVVVFDEAQRAWTKDQATSFMKRSKGIENFHMSEPDFLIDIMDRHDSWCVIVCLIGGGQEINKGEAGLDEWMASLISRFQDWLVYYSDKIVADKNYIKNLRHRKWLMNDCVQEKDLHLSVSVRSFRSEKLSELVQSILNISLVKSQSLYQEVNKVFPIVLTRDLEVAKKWLRTKSKGTERTGILISSGARRLRAVGVDAANGLRSDSGAVNIANWFLNDKTDVRSSYFLEIPATQFVIQGLELDWTCVCWGADLRANEEKWEYKKFKGTKWMNISSEIEKEYLINTYRVLLTRARQGMIIFIPKGTGSDQTRLKDFYDNTYHYLREIGVKEVC